MFAVRSNMCRCGGTKVIEQRGDNLMTQDMRRVIYIKDFRAQMCPPSTIVRVFCAHCGTIYHEDSIL